jgi:hypothetical protein
MPWQGPNNMTEEEGWAATAYVIKLNRMNPPPTLNAETAAEFHLHPEAAAPSPIPVQAASPPASSTPTTVIVGAAVLLVVAIVVVIRIRRRGSAQKDR